MRIFGTDYPTPDGTCIRDYVHVNDLADAHMRALNHLLDGHNSQCINLGTGSGISIRELLATIEEITGKKVPHIFADRRAGDPPHLVAGVERALHTLGWTARYSTPQHIIATAWQWLHRSSH